MPQRKSRKANRIARALRLPDKVAAPLASWPDGVSGDPLAVLEADVRGLTRQLAEAQFNATDLAEQHVRSMRTLLLELSNVVDAFGRVFQDIREKEDVVTPEMKAWTGNFSVVRRLLERVLADQGVTSMEELDSAFDARWHTVADVVVAADLVPGTITGVIRPGLFWRDEVLRKSEVVVSVQRQDEKEAFESGRPR